MLRVTLLLATLGREERVVVCHNSSKGCVSVVWPHLVVVLLLLLLLFMMWFMLVLTPAGRSCRCWFV